VETLLFEQQAATLLNESEKSSIMELTTSWKEEGLELGRERESQLVLRLLRKRFGALDPEMEARIRQFSFERLEELGEACLDLTSLSELKDWIATR